MTTIRDRIIDAIKARLAIIRTANAYATEAGASVHLVRAHLASGDLPAVVVWPQVEEAAREYGEMNVIMPVLINALAEHGISNPSDVAEGLLGDLIEAMTGRTWAMAYTSGGTHEIESGDTIIGATSGATALVQSLTVTSGSWAGGDAVGVLTLRRLTGAFSSENLDIGTDLNVATTNGVTTATKAIAAVTGSLAKDIVYTGGGVAEYPEDDDTTTAVSATFTVKYDFKIGNPFA